MIYDRDWEPPIGRKEDMGTLSRHYCVVLLGQDT